MLPYLNPTRLQYVVFISILLHFLPVLDLKAQVASFQCPDTVYVGGQVNITNQSTPGQEYYWSFCSGNTLLNPVGTNIGNPGNLLNVASYMTLVKDGNTCYSFFTNRGTLSVVRYNHGASFSNSPISWTNIGGLGLTQDILGIKIRYDNGIWIGFVNDNDRIVRLNFGPSLSNNAPVVSQLGPYSMLNSAHCIDVFQENGNWVGYLTCSVGNNLVRLDFGNNLLNTPMLTNLGTVGGSLNMPFSFRMIRENGIWYALVANSGDNTLTRLTFGSSLFNDPSGVTLGSAIGGTTPGGIALIRDCESTTGFQLNYSTSSADLIWRLTFPNGILGPVTGTSLGNIGALSRPSHFSELFRVGDTLLMYAVNRQNYTLTRFHFLPCTNASLPSSSSYDPPPFSYSQPGTYNIQLIVNEGLPNQVSFCKSIVVIAAAPINVIAEFSAPDTVCVGSQINITNQSTPGQNYYWSFCSGNTLLNPVGTNIGNPGNRLDVPVYITLVKDGGTCYSFITNHGTNAGVASVTRYNHGNSFSNSPVSSTNLTGFGMTDSILGIKICKDNGQWIGFVCNSSNIIRLNFGSSLNNSPAGTMLGPYSELDGAHCIDILKENGNWVGYITCATANNLVRLNFPNGLLNPPVPEDLGTIGGTLNMPYSFRVINENGIWYALVANSGNNTLTRLTFGNSLFNTPTGVNLGPAIQTTTPGGITLIRDCESTTGFQLNYSSSSPNLIWRLSFPSGITGPVTGTSLGNIGNMERPAHFSELFRVGDTLFLYATNRDGNSLTRLRFMPCTNASVPSSTLYNPPPFSYNQVGSYNIQLIVNEGDPTQAGLCKSVIVMPQQLINLGSDREICPGTTTTLDAGAGFLSYLWSTGATTRMITVSDSGIYWAKGTRYGCEAFDTINVSLFPVTQVYLGRDTTICVGQTVTFDAGSCSGCSYLWSNLTTGQTNIGTGQTYTTGITGEYSVIVTGTNGCPTRDSVQLFTASALIQGYADTTLCYGTPFYTGGALQTHPGIYFDTIPVTGKCDSIIQTTLRYKPEIPVSLGNDTIVCAGSPIKLRTGVPSAEYQWQDGSTDSTFTVFVPGSYWVMVTKEGCNAADSIMVGECISPLWFPNAFTPNGDGVNDTFYPPGWGVIYYEILIFDRWGRKVFESNKIEPGWDGSINGNLCSDGVYVFIATYSMADSSGETYHAKGSITLLR